MRATPEDVLQEDLPDDVDIEFLSLDDNDLRYDEPSAFGEDSDLDTIDEHDSDGTGGKDGEDDDDDMADWPEDTSGTSADEAVHIEGIPRSEMRLEAR